MNNVLFRADGGVGVGAGHLMRCMSLGQALFEQGARISLALATWIDLPKPWHDMHTDIHIQNVMSGSEDDCRSLLSLAQKQEADWIVADSYSFSTNFLNKLASSDSKVLYIDDIGERNANSAVVLNPNIGSKIRYQHTYDKPERVLLGEDYFLLRQSIRTLERKSEPGRVLVTFGADDNDNMAFEFLRLVVSKKLKLSADIVCTAPNDGIKQLREMAKTALGDIVIHDGPLEIAPLMAKASIMVCAGGGTICEAASLGLPSIIIVRADNQLPGSMALAERGAAIFAGKSRSALPNAIDAMEQLLSDKEGREKMGRNGRRLIDGRGAIRVAEYMQQLANFKGH